ncbi:MAG: ATP-binding protein [Bacteroidota bacterium]
MSESLTASALGRRLLLGGLLLLGVLGGTWMAEQASLRAIAADAEREATQTVSALERSAARRLAVLEAQQGDLAQRVARAAAVQAGLRAAVGRAPTATPEADTDAMYRYLGGLALGERLAVEVYTPTQELIGWQGFSLPLGSAAEDSTWLRGRRTGIVNDGVARRALVVWEPVRSGLDTLGAVRVMRLVEQRVPVRNRYLQDYSVTDVWREAAGLPFAVAFDRPETLVAMEQGVLLRGSDGTPLARLAVAEPSADVLLSAAAARWHAVEVFWVVVLLGWIVAGMWQAHGLVLRHAQDERTWAAWWRGVVSLTACTVAFVAARYGLLAADAPALWMRTTPTFDALFDPAYLASDLGAGLARTLGDLLVTSAAAVLIALAVLDLALRLGRRLEYATVHSRSGLRSLLAGMGLASLGGGLLLLVALGVRFVLRDATLDYFERSGPMPEPLTLLAFAALLAGVLACVLVLAALLRFAGAWLGRGEMRGRYRAVFLMGTGGAVVIAFGYSTGTVSELLPVEALALFLAASFALAAYLRRTRFGWATLLSLRVLPLAVLVLSMLAYPLLYQADETLRRERMVEAAYGFRSGQDPRVVLALEQVLADARANPALQRALAEAAPGVVDPDSLDPEPTIPTPVIPADSLLDDPDAPAVPRISRRALMRQRLDSLATDLVTGSLLSALGDYTVAVELRSPVSRRFPEGRTLGRFEETSPVPLRRSRGSDPLRFGALRQTYVDAGEIGFFVQHTLAQDRRGVYRYAGVGPVRVGDDDEPTGWLLIRAEPKPARYVSETPFPRVLVPAGLFEEDEAAFSFAEYQDDVLARTRGALGGPLALDPALRADLTQTRMMWRDESVEERPTLVYYWVPGGSDATVIAVRAPALVLYDHLYNLLRLALSGLPFALGAWVFGVVLRWRAGLFPPRKTRFRDKVLNRFLLVGVAGVIVAGLVGQRVIVEQNRQATQDRLQQRLQRVEAAIQDLALDDPTLADAPITRLLEAVRPDVLGQRLGLDVNLYRGPLLSASSRSQLVRQNLIDRRLPMPVYAALFVDGQRFAFGEDQIGTYTYTTGYKAIANERGQPIGVIAVPTLPEQLTIEEEQARIVAYLFGTLLVLSLAMVLITVLLTNRLTRPFQRLREGLRAIGEGQEAEPLPVEERDEVGELVESFNTMQRQLVESRRQLAAQERELAWREMARQVAHEIKNPLTPMKLSVQHLRRAYQPGDERFTDARFEGLLDRTSGTLIEQIDALSRIASEFASFARLPRRRIERVDLNAVVREAAAAIRDEAAGLARAEIRLALHGAPLWVEADREELRRVYINLLKNALQAMPEERPDDAPPDHITVWTERRRRAWSAVTDTGLGIPEDVQPRIFTPNFSTKNSGMGLGLAIVKKAIEDLGGTIRFETEAEAGTTFFLDLPLSDEEQPLSDEEHGEDQRAQGSVTPAEGAASGDGAVLDATPKREPPNPASSR